MNYAPYIEVGGTGMRQRYFIVSSILFYINSQKLGTYAFRRHGRYLLCSPSQRGTPALPHPVNDPEFLAPTQPWVFQVFNVFQKSLPDSTRGREARLPVIPHLSHG